MQPRSHHRFDVYLVFKFDTHRNDTEFRQTNCRSLILAFSASALMCFKHVCVFYCMHIYICIQGSKVVQKASSKYWCEENVEHVWALCLCSFSRFVHPYSSQFPLNPVIPLIIFLIVLSSLWCIFILIPSSVCFALILPSCQNISGRDFILSEQFYHFSYILFDIYICYIYGAQKVRSIRCFVKVSHSLQEVNCNRFIRL